MNTKKSAAKKSSGKKLKSIAKTAFPSLHEIKLVGKVGDITIDPQKLDYPEDPRGKAIHAIEEYKKGEGGWYCIHQSMERLVYSILRDKHESVPNYSDRLHMWQQWVKALT